MSKIKVMGEINVQKVKEIDKTDPRNSVMIIGCLNKSVYAECVKIAKDNSMNVVTLEDKVIDDYVNSKSSNNIQEFLNNKTNRNKARKQALKLFKILSGDCVYEDDDFRFKRTDVTKLTGMSHSEAKRLLDVLNTFGYVEFLDKNVEFRFNFDNKEIMSSIEDDVFNRSFDFYVYIQKYNSVVNDLDVSDDEKTELKNKFKNFVLEKLGLSD
jgi:hypothetical protein